MDSKKEQLVTKIVGALQKRFGKESVNWLGNATPDELERIPSQSIAIDEVTGGGYPLGRIVEIFGGASSGKSTACYHAIAAAQQKYPDKICGLIDSEYSFDGLYAAQCGVDIAALVVAQPTSGTEGFGILEGMIDSGGFSLIVVDSVAAMVPREEVEEEDFGKSLVGVQARMMSRALRKLTSVIGRSRCVVIFTNQIREKVGVLYGSPEVVSGGRALEYYSSIRLKFTRLKAIEEGTGENKEKSGVRTRVEAVKNKTAAPFRRGEFIITFGKGIDDDAMAFQAIIDRGLVEMRGGGNFYLDGERIARGQTALKEYFAANPAVYDRLKAELKTKTKGAPAAAEAEVAKVAEAEADAAAAEAAAALLEEGEV